MNEENLVTKQVSFDYTVQPLKGVELTERCPLTGKIKSVTMSFPPGCSGLVDVAFGHGSTNVCPYNGYIALDDASPTFTDIDEPVKMNERLWCEMRNGDDIYPHTISVLVVIVGKYGDIGGPNA